MRVTVCELPDNRAEFESAWRELVRYVGAECSALVVLPELPFSTWFAFAERFDLSVWNESKISHEEALCDLRSLNAAVIFSMPVERRGSRYNEVALVDGERFARGHRKRYLPSEPGFWEGNWYAQGAPEQLLLNAGGAAIGVQVCTELWMFEMSRRYGMAGADLIAVPRATPWVSRKRWLLGGRVAAIVSGAYCLSSNRSGANEAGRFGGLGWIVGPEGEVIATTSSKHPFATCDIDLAAARGAKSTYPRYVRGIDDL